MEKRKINANQLKKTGLAALLSASLVFSMGGFALAGTSNNTAKAATATAQSVTKQDVATKKAAYDKAKAAYDKAKDEQEKAESDLKAYTDNLAANGTAFYKDAVTDAETAFKTAQSDMIAKKNGL
ncbi:MAG: hypothetical protein ACOX41_10070 [Anaerovoracaceae bacterium]|jgi:hypothetical protein